MSEDERATPAGQPAVVHQTVVMVGSPKNEGLALVLALFFGPLGLLYSTIGGALVMFGIGLIVAFSFAPVFTLLLAPFNMLWAWKAATWHNEDLEEAAKELEERAPQSSAAV